MQENRTTHDGQVILVTGANKGIGLETARQLGLRGVTVLLGARDRTRGEEAARRLRGSGKEARIDARFVPLDVTDPASIDAAARWIDATFGRLDVLVNNAGIARTSSRAGSVPGGAKPSETRLEDVRAVFEVNVFGVIAVTTAMIPLLRKAKSGGCVVNVSSGLGSLSQLSDPGWEYAGFAGIAYPASKAALNMLTVQFAKELRASGIRVNSAEPGFTATDLNGHRGTQTVEEGARASVRLALWDQGPTGGFFNERNRVPW